MDQYFNAVNAKDIQTLTSFSAVTFDKKVDRWAITNTLDEDRRADAPLPALAQKVKDLEAELAANTKDARAYDIDHGAGLDQVEALKKDGQPVPAKLAGLAAEWDKFSAEGPRAQEGLANAQDASWRRRSAA